MANCGFGERKRGGVGFRSDEKSDAVDTMGERRGGEESRRSIYSIDPQQELFRTGVGLTSAQIPSTRESKGGT